MGCAANEVFQEGNYLFRVGEPANRFYLLREGEVSKQSGVSTEVVDTVGAGDAFTAALMMGWLHGHELDTINRHACEVAAFVCSQSGATPELPLRLRRATTEPHNL